MVHLKILLPMSAIIVVLFITLLSSCTAEEVKVTHEEVVVTDPSADSRKKLIGRLATLCSN